MIRVPVSDIELLCRLEELHKNFPLRQGFPEVTGLMLQTERELLEYAKGRLLPRVLAYYVLQHERHERLYGKKKEYDGADI